MIQKRSLFGPAHQSYIFSYVPEKCYKMMYSKPIFGNITFSMGAGSHCEFLVFPSQKHGGFFLVTLGILNTVFFLHKTTHYNFLFSLAMLQSLLQIICNLFELYTLMLKLFLYFCLLKNHFDLLRMS